MMLRIAASTLFLTTALVCQSPPCRAQAQGAQSGSRDKPVDVSATDEGVLIWSTSDGAFRGSIEGRLHLDTALYFGSLRPLSNGTEIRRGRIGFRMRLWHRWDAKVEADFADNQAIVKDMWISYALSPRSAVKAGQFTEPFNLEQITSSRYNTFIERSLVAGLAPDRHVGLTVDHRTPRWQAVAGLFGQPVGQKDVSGDDQGFDLTVRVTGLPVASPSPRRLVHLGLAASYRTPPAASQASLADRGDLRLRLLPETHVSRATFVDTGTIHGVDHFTMLGLEAAAVAGCVSLQAEWTGERLSRAAPGGEANFSGWYAFASWFPTGEHRAYRPDSADFGRVVPRSPRGALELAARYSTVNLTDVAGGVHGGSERIVTAGANYYFNPNVRLMINASRVINDRFASGDSLYPANDRFNILQARLALAY